MNDFRNCHLPTSRFLFPIFVFFLIFHVTFRFVQTSDEEERSSYTTCYRSSRARHNWFWPSSCLTGDRRCCSVSEPICRLVWEELTTTRTAENGDGAQWTLKCDAVQRGVRSAKMIRHFAVLCKDFDVQYNAEFFALPTSLNEGIREYTSSIGKLVYISW